MNWNDPLGDRLKPEYLREEEAKDRVQQRLDASEHQHEFETVGAGRISHRRIALVGAALVLAWVISRVAVAVA